MNSIRFNERNCFHPIEACINRRKIEFIDLFARLTELDVQKYLPSFPYWGGDIWQRGAPVHSTAGTDTHTSTRVMTSRYLMG